MDDSVRMEVLEGSNDLNDVALHLQLVEPLSSSYQLVQRLVGAQLEQDVNVFIVLKEMFEPNDVSVVKRSVDLNLAHEFLLSSALGQGCFWDNLGGRDSLVVDVRELIALGEASLS